MFPSSLHPKFLLAIAGTIALAGCQYLPLHRHPAAAPGTPRAAATVARTTPIGTPPAGVAAPVAPTHPWWEKLKPGSVRCEAGLGFEVRKVDTSSAVELVWRKRDYVLRRVSTTTGAYRYEDPASGLVLIQIPAKMLLLNARLGQRLADECQMVGTGPLVATAATATQPAARTPVRHRRKTVRQRGK